MCGRLLVVFALWGCVSPDTVECDDGTTCPAGTECRELTEPAARYCATQAQIEACMGRQPFTDCSVDDVENGRCYDGVCIEAGCGNGRLDPEELCDDGNAEAGDTCAPGCISDGQCGTGVVDRDKGETCDDGNRLDHDGCTSRCTDETLRWSRRVLAPIPRARGMIAYDARRDRLVVFGGISPDGLRADTWELDGDAWVRFEGPNPPARQLGAMAFDGERIVLTGTTTETWLYDGLSWTAVFTDPSPGTQFAPAMTYDSKRDRVVLFGSGQTWEWDGTTWMRITTANAPSERIHSAMAYDPVRGVIVLAGGKHGTSGAALDDTWTYNGTNWTLVSGAGLPATESPSMAFDPTMQGLVLYDGCATSSCTGSSVFVTFNGTTWSAPATPPMPDRTGELLAATSSRVMMFGGLDEVAAMQPYASDVWVLDGTTWRELVSPGPRAEFLVTNDERRREIVLFDDADDSDAVPPETWVLSRDGWRKYSGGPLVDTGAMTYDHANGNVVMFVAGDTPQTWTWNGSTWTQKFPTTSPTVHSSPTLGFDGTHVVLFGGRDNGSPSSYMFLDLTWTWDGTNWTQVTSPMKPPGSDSTEALMGYDPLRKQLLLANGSGITWTFAGTDWTGHPQQPPALAKGKQLVWSPALESLVAVTIGFVVWTWDGTSWQQRAPVNEPSELDAYNAIGLVTALDGTSILMFGSQTDAELVPSNDELWQLKWESSGRRERCDGSDLDLDQLVGCGDPDCWQACTPTCPPGTSCPTGAPSCGDGTCNSVFETCRTCADDCTCPPVCGDGYCDAGETCAGECP